jgi:hypothetical protein
VEVTVTRRLKGSIEGRRNEPTAGVVVTARVASLVELGFFLHPPPGHRADTKAMMIKYFVIFRLFGKKFFPKIFILMMASKRWN